MSKRKATHLLDSPPAGFIPAEIAVKVYHFARPSLIRKVREGSLRLVKVRNASPRLNSPPWIYYNEYDLRRLWRARADFAMRHGGWAAAFCKMPPWVARHKPFPVPDMSVNTRYAKRRNAAPPCTQRART